MSLRILLVEDDPDIGDYMKLELGDIFTGSKLEVYQSSRLALTSLDRNSYDIVISDMGLKDAWTGGKDVLEKANEQGAFSVLFSGLGHYPGLHLDYVLKKPFFGNELQEMKSIFDEGNWMSKLKQEATSFVTRVRAKYTLKQGVFHEVSGHCATKRIQQEISRRKDLNRNFI